MKKSLLKDFIRSLGKNPTRFFSILFIIALGVGFFAGINATRPDMEKSAWNYYKKTNLMDIRSYNPLGYSNEDLDKIGKIDEILTFQGVRRLDLFLENSGEKVVMRLFSMDLNKGNIINKPVVVEGRLPEKEGEIAINTGKYIKAGVKLNDRIKVQLPEGKKLEEYLTDDSYTVVGFIESPIYISYLRDRTNIGGGTISTYGIVSENNFKKDSYEEIFFKVKGSDDLNPKEEPYKNLIEETKVKIDAIGKESITKKTQSLKDELEKGKKELEDKKKEAKDELDKGERDLKLAQLILKNQEFSLFATERDGNKRIKETEEKIFKSKEEIIEGRKKYNDGYLEWSKGNQEYLNGKAELDNGKLELDNAKVTLNNGQAQLNNSYNQLISAKSQLDTFADALDTINQLKSSIPSPLSPSDLQYYIDEVSKVYPELAPYLLYIDVNDPLAPSYLANYLDDGITQLNNMYNNQLATYNDGLAQYDDGLAQYNSGLASYETGEEEYLNNKAKLDEAKKKVDEGKKELDASKKKLDDGDLEIKDGELKLEKGKKDLEDGIKEASKSIEDGWKEYYKGFDKFKEEKKKAEEKIEKADEDILKAERDIKEIPDKWLVYNREGNPDYSSYFDNAIKIGNVAKVFPLFFFLVAALVSLTTITRMVDEERQVAGTLKALGYKNGAISVKYISYSLLASILGSLLGLFAGFNIFPRVIMNAYNMLYSIPPTAIEFNPILGALSLGFAIFSTVSAALFALGSTIKESPAQLMMPKAPPPGKRIFLERIGPLWKRLKFSQKVTMRNLFLYKKRLLMTILGIAGCTALIVTGFGIKDSIEAMVKNQFKELSVYDELVIMDLKKPEGDRDVDKILKENPEIISSGKVIQDSLIVKSKDSDRTYDANLLVPENLDNLDEFIVLRDRVTRKPLKLEGEGVIINEKLAEILKVAPGDKISYLDGDNNEFTVTIMGLCENYLENFIYMSSENYKKTHLLKPEYNGLWLKLSESGRANEKELNTKIMENKGVITILSAKELSKNFEEQVSSLIIVVLVLIISAGLLAFVVLYNLNNVNITERRRELATIKVLGFRDGEVSAYVYRENLILTFLGSLVGLFFGGFLHKYIMGTMELDNMMFGKDILPNSYLYAVVITFIFSIIVNFIMHFSLKKIDMVESLKSVE